jgi:hypothetical protein
VPQTQAGKLQAGACSNVMYRHLWIKITQYCETKLKKDVKQRIKKKKERFF